jgi:hypothetical protein
MNNGSPRLREASRKTAISVTNIEEDDIFAPDLVFTSPQRRSQDATGPLKILEKSLSWNARRIDVSDWPMLRT